MRPFALCLSWQTVLPFMQCACLLRRISASTHDSGCYLQLAMILPGELTSRYYLNHAEVQRSADDHKAEHPLTCMETWTVDVHRDHNQMTEDAGRQLGFPNWGKREQLGLPKWGERERLGLPIGFPQLREERQAKGISP